MSGATQGQIIGAFRFLYLIDDKGQTQRSLRELVEAEDRAPILDKIMRSAYPEILKENLTAISPKQFSELFQQYNVGGSTRVRAERFFVKLAQEVKLPISPRIAEQKRSSPSQTRKRRSNGTSRRLDTDEATSERGAATQSPGKTFSDRVLDKFPEFDPSWDPDIQKKWFEGIERLMTATEKSGSGQ
jgi:membrane peptidoglycan carboxypeptidase